MLNITFDASSIARMARLKQGGHIINEHLKDGMDALGQEAVEAVRSHMNFTQGYSTGALEASITAVPDADLAVRIEANQPYAPFVEYGTGQRGAASGVRPGPGYSYGDRPGMAAEPYMTPALEEMKPVFEQYMSEAVEQGLSDMSHD